MEYPKIPYEPKLTDKQVGEHLAALRVSCDPSSPFFGMVAFDDLLALPTPQQWQVFRAMPPDLSAMVKDYKRRVEEGRK